LTSHPPAPKPLTGRRRNRKTKFTVRLGDAAARTLITIGGFGTIIAVSTVFIFLVAVVIPLFRSPEAGDMRAVTKTATDGMTEDGEPVIAETPLHIAADDYNLLAWAAYPDGMIRVFEVATGRLLDEHMLAPTARMTAASFPQHGDQAAIGYEDGTIRLVRIAWELAFLDIELAPEPLQGLETLEVVPWEQGLAQRTPERQIRFMTLTVEPGEPIASGSDSPVKLIDHTGGADRPIIVMYNGDGTLRITQIRARRNLMTRRTTYTTTGATIPYQRRHEPPRDVRLSGLGDNVYVIWRDGLLHRFDTRDYAQTRLAEEIRLIDRADRELTAVGFLIGKTTLVIGDSAGDAHTWFRIRPEGEETLDGLSLRRIAILEGEGAGAVRSISSSQRKRIVAIGHDGGRIRLHNVTNDRPLIDLEYDSRYPISTAVLNPRDNGLVAIAGDTLFQWNLDMPHPEASLRAIFRPIWYEGYSGPALVWQSTGGTDDFESKYSLRPLIFGTIKATFYSMLFGVPLAILAAIYTSEFLHRRIRSVVKPVVEMMASLPSVVLGFLAGLVVAPFIEDIVPVALSALITIPAAFLFCAYLWQMLPSQVRIRLDALRITAIALALPLGIALAAAAGPIAEQAFFGVATLDPATGDIVSEERNFRLWLGVGGDPGYRSSAIGGWFILFLPLSALLTGMLMSQIVNPMITRSAGGWSRQRLATTDILKFACGTVIALLIALAFSAAFSAIWDARGTYLDTYVQRNALIVGFIMGFAIIPIIYTIADDAMNAVPEHLRSASLGAGATRWQTAIRIILPTAMSGLFSAVMIGFGRAVGETMIVLMAAGNTPVMDWNIFSGFRTLSANIAVELPEAVKNSTNYRMLFLAALTLFLMTFAINTVAETIRQRYRKRAFQL